MARTFLVIMGWLESTRGAMKVQLGQLEVICAVAEEKSFSKAARKLHLTQPAVSAQVQSMETALGTRLFVRHSRGVQLTRAGKVVYEHARRILELKCSMEQSVQNLVNTENKHLVVGASETVGNYALPCSIWTFKQRYPDVNLKLELGSSSQVIQHVVRNTIDLGIVEGPVDNEDLVVTDISSDELVVITPADAGRENWESLPLQELSTQPFILREEGSGLREAIETALADKGIKVSDLNVVAQMYSNDAIKSAVESGLGISILSRLSVQRDIRRGHIKALRLEGLPMKVPFQLVYRAGKFHSQVAKRFISFIVEPSERAFCC